MTKKIKCEVWTRIVGYLRPVDQWNEGKASEFLDRQTFKMPSNENLESKQSEKIEIKV